MNYQLIYDNIIAKARSENRKRKQGIYYEKHHIIPKCIGGTNDKDNLVLLTAKEHFVCHKLLVEIYPENHKIFYAYFSMSNLICKGRKYKIGALEYSRIKNKFNKLFSGSGNHNFGKKLSEEHLNKLKEAHTGERNHNYGKKGILSPYYGIPRPKEVVEKIIKNRIGKYRGENNKRFGIKISEELRQKFSDLRKGTQVGEKNHHYGKKHSEETKRKMSELKINASFIECPYCHISSKSASNMKRYHFENCKQNPNYIPKDLIICPYCYFGSLSEANMKRWHFDNCKYKPKE